MPSKKRKYNARFPAGRIKKIMQTDEEVGKVAQAVPIIISRTLELFVESLLKKSMEVTLSRNAKTLSPSHVKQCILSESRFDFLKDLVRNVPSVSAAEERELSLQSANSSPTEPRYPDQAAAQMELLRLQQQSSSQPSTSRSQQPPSQLRGRRPQTHSHPPTETSVQPEIHQNYNGKQNSIQRIPDQVQPEDLTRRRVPNFYQETLPDSDSSQSQDLISNHNSVIQVNPAYTVRQLSVDAAEPKKDFSQRQPAAPHFHVDLTRVPLQTSSSFESALQPRPILNFDFSNPLRPEVRYGSYDPASGPPPVQTPAQNHTPKPSLAQNHASRPSLAQRSHSLKEPPALVPISSLQIRPVPALEIDEDYDT